MIESKNFIITYEYEKVFLNFKNEDKSILIGEFYGNPYTAIISKDEDFCVVGGEGIIIYYLNEPYLEYKNNYKTNEQWKEWGRDNTDSIVWIEKIEQIGNKIIRLTSENKEQFILNVAQFKEAMEKLENATGKNFGK
ncbi:MAG: hypothetical protein K6B70_04335 [Clostridia bacterium]|nr:hypothetical protein [Clostridia bacterium]